MPTALVLTSPSTELLQGCHARSSRAIVISPNSNTFSGSKWAIEVGQRFSVERAFTIQEKGFMIARAH